MKIVLMLVCDGRKGLPDSVAVTWPQTVLQRNPFAYAGRQHWSQIAKDRGGPHRNDLFALSTRFQFRADHQPNPPLLLDSSGSSDGIGFIAEDFGKAAQTRA